MNWFPSQKIEFVNCNVTDDFIKAEGRFKDHIVKYCLYSSILSCMKAIAQHLQLFR